MEEFINWGGFGLALGILVMLVENLFDMWRERSKHLREMDAKRLDAEFRIKEKEIEMERLRLRPQQQKSLPAPEKTGGVYLEQAEVPEISR